MIVLTQRLRILVLLCLLPLTLAACGTPRVLEVSQAAAPARDVAGTVQIYVATTREPSAQPVWFSGERAPRLSFARLDITVPRNHKPGELELPDSGPGDPMKHFVATNLTRLELAPVVADVRKDLQRRPPDQRDVLVFGLDEHGHRLRGRRHDCMCRAHSCSPAPRPSHPRPRRKRICCHLPVPPATPPHPPAAHPSASRPSPPHIQLKVIKEPATHILRLRMRQ